MKHYKIIIPSYQRAECLVQKTLATLENTNVFKHDPEMYIFVADDDEAEAYAKHLEHYCTAPFKIIVGVRGIPNQRNFIQEYFAEGDWLFMIDDDISKINFYDEPCNKSRPLYELHEFLMYAFTTTEKLGLKMWGVNANTNPLNMQSRISVGLIYLVGNFIGLINSHDVKCYVDEGDIIPSRRNYKSGKESHERAIKHYLHNGGVAKFKHIGVESKYWKEPGGHQISRTVEGELDASLALIRLYPDLLTYRDMDGVPDIVFRTGKTKTYPLFVKLDTSHDQLTMEDLFGI